jgi:hypothetical protein
VPTRSALFRPESWMKSWMEASGRGWFGPPGSRGGGSRRPGRAGRPAHPVTFRPTPPAPHDLIESPITYDQLAAIAAVRLRTCSPPSRAERYGRLALHPQGAHIGGPVRRTSVRHAGHAFLDRRAAEQIRGITRPLSCSTVVSR